MDLEDEEAMTAQGGREREGTHNIRQLRQRAYTYMQQRNAFGIPPHCSCWIWPILRL